MPKRLKSKTKLPPVTPGPHDWLFQPTAGLAGPLADLAVNAVKVILNRLRDSGPLEVVKSGPGVVTIQAEEVSSAPMFDDSTAEPKKSAYKRIALVGGERMQIQDYAIGKRDGVIIKMLAAKGSIMGVEKDVVCEVPLSGLAMAFTFANGDSIMLLIKREMDKIGKTTDEFADRLAGIRAEIEAEEIERERLSKQRYVEQKSTEYSDKNWGAW